MSWKSRTTGAVNVRNLRGRVGDGRLSDLRAPTRTRLRRSSACSPPDRTGRLAAVPRGLSAASWGSVDAELAGDERRPFGVSTSFSFGPRDKIGRRWDCQSHGLGARWNGAKPCENESGPVAAGPWLSAVPGVALRRAPRSLTHRSAVRPESYLGVGGVVFNELAVAASSSGMKGRERQ